MYPRIGFGLCPAHTGTQAMDFDFFFKKKWGWVNFRPAHLSSLGAETRDYTDRLLALLVSH